MRSMAGTVSAPAHQTADLEDKLAEKRANKARKVNSAGGNDCSVLHHLQQFINVTASVSDASQLTKQKHQHNAMGPNVFFAQW